MRRTGEAHSWHCMFMLAGRFGFGSNLWYIVQMHSLLFYLKRQPKSSMSRPAERFVANVSIRGTYARCGCPQCNAQRLRQWMKMQPGFGRELILLDFDAMSFMKHAPSALEGLDWHYQCIFNFEVR